MKLLSAGLDVGMEGILWATVQLTARKSERLPDGIELQRRHNGAGDTVLDGSLKSSPYTGWSIGVQWIIVVVIIPMYWVV